MFRDPRLSSIAAFLSSIGISVDAGRVDVPTAFPPGDVLHEAAHGGEEIATIAWSRGDSPTIIAACRSGNYIGFPHMVRWVRAL